MNLKLTLAACVLIPLTLNACSKQEKAPASEQSSASEVAPVESEQVSPEQQAAIAALDQPVLDEKNTDIAESVSNVPADQATAATETETEAAH